MVGGRRGTPPLARDHWLHEEAEWAWLTLEHLLVVHLEVVGTGHLQEVHVVLAVETGHFLECRREGALNENYEEGNQKVHT